MPLREGNKVLVTEDYDVEATEHMLRVNARESGVKDFVLMEYRAKGKPVEVWWAECLP